MRAWGYTDNMESVRELRLSFDRKSLGDWFGSDLAPGKVGNPELMFHDKRAVECARLVLPNVTHLTRVQDCTEKDS